MAPHRSEVVRGRDETNTIEQGLLQREREQNTGVGMGMAMPHTTLTEARTTRVGVFGTARPIDQGVADGESVDVFFVVEGPPGEQHTHLTVLSDLGRLSLQTAHLEDVRRAGRPEDVAEAMRRHRDTLRTA
ncbi:MAG: PTS sugar transporter subunit IIA [Myxococcota bacterium]